MWHYAKISKRSQTQRYDHFDNHLWHMFMSFPICWNLAQCIHVNSIANLFDPHFPNFQSKWIWERNSWAHFVALDVGYIICQEQLCNCIRGCHATFLLKNTLFKQEVAWQPLRERQGCAPIMLEPHIWAFKWSVVCFSTISPCEDISGYVQKCWFY